MKPDIETANLGTIWTFRPTTDAGLRWLKRHTRGETIAEHRYGADIARGMLKAGLVLQDVTTGRQVSRG